MVIDGKKIADEIIGELKRRPGPRKSLAVILVGDDASSLSFIKQKEKVASELGVDFRIYKFPSDINENNLREEISKVAGDQKCGGLILQLPLPESINRDEVIKAIPPEKDIDNLTGGAPVLSPAVGVVEKILEVTSYKLYDKRVTVVGLGLLIGGPIAEWLKGGCAELYSLDTGDDLGILKQSDLVISGVGKAGLIKPEMLKNNAFVIDFGYGIKNGKISGDFNPLGAEDKSINYTPTPGGTGPILVAEVFKNFYKLNGK